MTKRGRLLCVGVALGLVAGCNPAGYYGKPTQRSSEVSIFKPPAAAEKPEEPKKETPPVPADYVWMEPKTDQMEPEVPIRFVTENDAFEWNRLKSFWTYEPAAKPAKPAKPAAESKPAKPAAPPAGPPKPVEAPDGQAGGVVKIKVPRGLPDPTAYIPGSNLPTAGKWELGKRLFFDDSYLYANTRESCATCHRPDRGFTDGLALRHTRTSPLGNVVYNRYLFWDGRATALEEVVQRLPEDEREQPNVSPEERHVWSGVIERLRKNPEYNARFLKVFGTLPTQDAVGKALATYLRTLLAGDSLYDQAEAARHGPKAQALEAADFAQALKGAKDETVKALGGEPAKKDDLAKRLAAGAKLFHDTSCIACHPGPVFLDNNFHNLGIGDSAEPARPGHVVGRFAAEPVGEKDPHRIGAYKTPTLRLLPKTGPYFHDASQEKLLDAVKDHVQVRPEQVNLHLDPLLRDDKDRSRGRDLHLKDDDLRALVTFLQALDADFDPVVKDRNNWPGGTKPPAKP